MISGWIFLSATSLLCVGCFLNGWRFARMDKNPLSGKTLFGQPVSGHDMPLDQIKWFGIAQMVFAPLFLLLAAALSFGLLGPVEGIETIRLG